MLVSVQRGFPQMSYNYFLFSAVVFLPLYIDTNHDTGVIILVTSCRPENYFDLMLIFNWKWKTIGENMLQMDTSVASQTI
jgi:hypothetical protein